MSDIYGLVSQISVGLGKTVYPTVRPTTAVTKMPTLKVMTSSMMK